MSRSPEITLTVTGDHFERAVPGDQCHCTIGEAVHDALADIMPALGLDEVNPATISVNPAEVAGEPCVGVSFVGQRDGRRAYIRFLLRDTAAFKVAYTTDNRATGVMRRRAQGQPYSLKATDISVRTSRAGSTTVGGRGVFTPEGHIKQLATYGAMKSETAEDTVKYVQDKLAEKKAAGSLSYTLSPHLKKFAEQAAKDSFQAKGTQTNRKPPIHVYRNRRFHAA
jgi:hypothetical protein